MQTKLSSALVRLTATLFLAIATASAARAASTIQTIFESQELVGSDVDASDLFGTSVAISGNFAIVGASADEESGDFSGTAYIFAFDGTSWNQQAKLNPSDGGQFGSAVAISGNTALVGSPFDSTVGLDRGAVYVFTFDGTTWTEQAKLFASDGMDVDFFGISVSLSGNTALIGAGAIGNRGAAYVFSRTGTTWSEQTKLTVPDSVVFGRSVALSGNRALIGDSIKNLSGAAYVFGFDGSTWSQQAELTALDAAADDQFGASVALSGDTALVGAPTKGTKDAGAAYIFAFDGATWSQQTKLQSPGHKNFANFGSSVALSDEMALVGAHDVVNSGAVYQFVLRRNVWTLRAQLLASDGVAGDYLGTSVALSGHTVLAGADDNFNSRGGRAYIFSLAR